MKKARTTRGFQIVSEANSYRLQEECDVLTLVLAKPLGCVLPGAMGHGWHRTSLYLWHGGSFYRVLENNALISISTLSTEQVLAWLTMTQRHSMLHSN